MGYALFFGVLIALCLSIASAVLFEHVVNDSALDLLTNLKTNTEKTQAELNALASRIPALQQCELNLLNTTMQLENCLANSTTMISLNTELIASKTNILKINTVSAANNTVITIIASSCARIASLESQILHATLNQTTTIPLTIQSGTVPVSLVGGNSFNIIYSLSQLILGYLNMVYLTLPKWDNSLTTNVGQSNPVIKFKQFNPEISKSAPVATADIFKPLLRTTSDRFVWSIASPQIVANTYKWDGNLQELEIHSVGTSEPLHLVALVKDLNVIMQFL